METQTLPRVTQMATGNLCVTRAAQSLRQPGGVGCGGSGREAREGGGMCALTADPCRCMAETHTTLHNNYPSIKGKFKK